MKRVLAFILAACCAAALSAQVRTQGETTRIDGVVELDHTVHDFGDILTGSGPVSCSFTIKNISDKPMAIYTVGSSCGCTGVTWTREPIQPGASGVVSATYSNDEGPYPFDKTLTVSLSNVRKPVILRLRGTAYQKQRPLSELYPVAFGPFALKEAVIKGGNLSQGSQRSGSVAVANLGEKPVEVRFEDVDPGLEVSVAPNPLPAGGTGRLTWTVTSDRDHWGKNFYRFTPRVDGKRYKGDGRQLSVQTFTKEDFSDWDDDRRAAAAQPWFEHSTVTTGVIPAGERVEAVFPFTNKGKTALRIYKVDSDWARTDWDSVPEVAPGADGTLTVRLDTTGLPEGEFLVIITLTTNTPLRPLVNLFITGAIK